MVEPSSIETPSAPASPCTHLEVTGDGAHFEAVVVSPAFAGLTRVRQHQLVYAALGDRMREEIHALSMKTYSPKSGPRADATARGPRTMQKLSIQRRHAASGEVRVAGAKNAALPILAASLLTAARARANVPQLNDVRTMVRLLERMGVKAERPARVTLDARQSPSRSRPTTW
jgi:acid stress-induced BolA-like protein IbaG/YrbA